MAKLPRISGRKAIAALRKAGYEVVRQRGSHVTLAHPDETRKQVTIPLHKHVSPGLLSDVLKDAKLTVEEFAELL